MRLEKGRTNETEFKPSKALSHSIDTAAIDALEREVDRLRSVARNVYEVWAGSEGIPTPETAAEAYLLQLVEQMRDEAKNGLRGHKEMKEDK